MVAEFVQSVPVGRIAAASEIADVIVFLASRRAGFVSGTSVLVDGGRSRSVD
jgi:NAD(P)-dependent dehydrogenase (short-subunit alcohol dehydrogenase family)